MSITETANNNNEELFSNHQSTLRATNSDLIDVMYEKSSDNKMQIQKYLFSNCNGEYHTLNGLV